MLGLMRVLVTGAARSIGRATAEILSERGHQVVATARDIDLLADFDEQARGRPTLGVVALLAFALSLAAAQAAGSGAGGNNARAAPGGGANPAASRNSRSFPGLPVAHCRRIKSAPPFSESPPDVRCRHAPIR